MMTGRQKARVYEMHPHARRIVEAILFLIWEAEQRRLPVTQYDLVKSLFLADRAHLNKYGRPITFDNYVAMVHGPVPSTAYDFLKENTTALRRYRIELPWEKEPAPQKGRGCFIYRHSARQASEDILSESDMEELRNALTVVQSLDFRQIRRLTHEDQAYIDAWEDEGDRKQYPMSYALLFATPDHEKAAELSYFSEHV